MSVPRFRAPAPVLAGWVVFTSLVVSPAAGVRGQVPTPESAFGFPPGADYHLADYPVIEGYFRALAAASDRVALREIGESTLGQTMVMAVISSEENLARLEHYRDVSRRLARVEGTPPEEASALAREGKVVVWIDGGLHATEVAHGQLMPELAHWLATDEGEEARRVRDQAIVLVMSNMNPDGLNIVAHWYNGNVGTPYEIAPVPELYHPYIGHDNNRDWYMFTQAETRNVARQLYRDWLPQVVYNHHQSGPFPGRIWVPPFENPVNPNLDPVIVTSLSEIGEAMKRRFAEEGKPGVSSGIVYDLWWNGSMRGAPDFHNMLGFLTETALYRYATPHCYGEDEIPETFGARAGYLPADRPTTQYPDPWKGGCWHIRDAMDYMMTASRAVLDYAAKHRQDILQNIYDVGLRQIARGETAQGGPFAYVLDPRAQHDPGALDELLRVFRIGGIEVRRASAPFTAGGAPFPAGSYVIGPQAFRPFVVDLMEPKAFPDRRMYPGGPPEPPYDMTGYELSLQMGITASRIMEPFELPSEVVDEVTASTGGLDDRGGDAVWLLSPRQNNASLAVNRLLAEGARVSRTTAAARGQGAGGGPRRGGVVPPGTPGGPSPAAPLPGTFVIQDADRPSLEPLARELGLRFIGAGAPPGGDLAELHPPRIGIYRGHVANMPEGWTRWVLDKYGFEHEAVDNARIRSGDLEGLDVLLFPDQDAAEILDGHAEGTMPPELVGGLGEDGVARLRSWIEGGGWLVATDEAIDFAIEQFGLPVENLVSGLSTEQFFIPGSLLHLEVDRGDPLAWGMSEDAIAFFVRSQSMEITAAGQEPRGSMGQPVVYARYGAGDVLASGWANGAEEYVSGRPAAIRVPVGHGQVVLIGFEPHFRGQPHNTFKLLFDPIWAAAADGLSLERSTVFEE